MSFFHDHRDIKTSIFQHDGRNSVKLRLFFVCRKGTPYSPKAIVINVDGIAYMIVDQYIGNIATYIKKLQKLCFTNVF